jgi:hypothetical protein
MPSSIPPTFKHVLRRTWPQVVLLAQANVRLPPIPAASAVTAAFDPLRTLALSGILFPLECQCMEWESLYEVANRT